MTFLSPEKPELNDLVHFGVKGMKWGVRKDRPDGVSSSVNRQAKKDAEEFTRAKLFYGKGAGTRRKLIKARVDAASAKDPSYKKAFDHHVANTDLGKRAAQAKRERKTKNAVSETARTARGVRHILNGNSQWASATAALLVGGVLYARKSGIDKVITTHAKKLYRDVSTNDTKRGAAFLRENGFNI